MHLAYVRGGFKAIIGALAEAVRNKGGVVHTGTKVDRIATSGTRATGLMVNGEFQAFDKIVSTVPITQFLKLVDPGVLGEDFRHDGVAYQGAVNVLLVLKEPLSRYYWMPVVESGVSFAGIVETTNLIRREDLGRISKALPSFNPGQILESHVHRAAFVEPVWTVNYSDRMPRRVLLNDSLFVLTTAQLYPEINSTSNCVSQVRESFARLATAPDRSPN